MPTAPTVISGRVPQTGTNSGNSDRQVQQIADMIFNYGPNINPMTLISRKSTKKRVGNQTFKVLNDKHLPRFNDVNGNQTAGDTSIEVDNGEYFRVGDIVENTRTGEHILVTNISSDTLTAVRGYDSGDAGTGTAMVDNDELMVIGTALSESASAPAARTPQTSTVTNYCQFFSRTLNLSEIRDNIEEYGPKEKQRQKDHQIYEFKKDIELAFKFGKPLEDDESDSPLDSSVSESRYKTGGLKYWIDNHASANVLDAGGALAQNQLWDFVAPMFEDMEEDVTGQKKSLMALCSRKAFRVFHSWAVPTLDLTPKDDTYGLQLVRYLTPVGVLDLVQDYTLRGDEYGDYMFVVNPMDLEYVYLNNMDLTVKPNIQQPDVHEIKDEVYGVIGLGIHRPELHGYIKNMALAA